MRLALANVLALVIYVGVIWICFAFVLSFATNSNAPLGFTAKLNNDSFGFALIYMMFIGPFALLAMLVYFIAFRAQPLAIAFLAVVTALLSFAFMSPVLSWRADVVVRGWITIAWSGVTAALAHHLVFALIRPRRVKENAHA